MVIICLFGGVSFKVCNNACIMPSFGKKCFYQFLLGVFKTNDAVDFEDNFLTILVIIKP